eukprot:CAMPEP_0113905204 /NCGR_PEP_ID=MMETSP0780_2-20120614/23846_1 /TAXON_ID=652834 /ORGANISM="Palpitomonas bilix" /LENGTH=189 /DNA_ID=CAMNT_0000899235 /DNA_START=29 /DNA_END=598 /DNA_ORIENTATION=- /assembly_acc=CAM_ASM_000599
MRLAAHPYSSKHIHANPAERLGVEFFPRAGCDIGHGFPSGIASVVPQQLQARGVTQEVWTRWMALYDELVTPHSQTCATPIIRALVVATIIGGFIYLAIPRARFSKLQKGMKKWLEIVRSELPPGVTCKPQTMQGVRMFGRSVYPVYRSVLSFAFTSNESAILETEEMVVGELEGQSHRCAPDRRYRVI